MTVALRQPMTQDQFFPWAEAQEGRYEFDGSRPVAMTGGNAGHSVISGNLLTALATRLRGTSCRPLGPDAGVATAGNAVRYPDALVTCSRFKPSDLTIPGVVVIFEVVSPTSGRVDRIVKVREYAAVASVRRYVIVESSAVGVTVMERSAGEEVWRTTTLVEDGVLRMPEIGIEIPVAEVYDGLQFPDDDETAVQER